MGQVQVTNNAYTTVATALTIGATSLVVASSSAFPAVTTASGNWFYACLQDTFANLEIVKVTNVSGATWTITRAVGGTTARAFVAGSVVELRVTAETLTDIQAANNAGQLLGNTWAVPAVIGSTTPNDANFTSINGGQLAGLRNRIINGGMQVTQRNGTNSVVVGSSASTAYSVDRWQAFRASGALGATVQQSTTGLVGGPVNFLALTRTPGDTATNQLVIATSLESGNMRDMQGKVVTLSFWLATVGAATTNGVSAILISGTGSDGNLFSGFTGSNNIVSQTFSSPSWSRFSITGTVPSNATQLGVYFGWTPTGTAGASDLIGITGVQLEIGSVATPFEQRPYGMELALCQRYYETGQAFAQLAQTTYIGYSIPYKVTKRIQPPTTTYTDLALNPSKFTTGAVNNLAASGGGVTAWSAETLRVDMVVTVSLANNWWGLNWASSAEL